MCTEVRRTETTVPAWNHKDVTIEIPGGLTHGQTLLVVRAILTQLGATQATMGATCFCGEPVTVSGLTPVRWPAPASSRLTYAGFVVEVSRGA